MSHIWKNGPQKQGHLLVLLAIADFADDDGFAWPSMRRIAEKSRMQERSAQRIVRQLEVDGWLEIDTGNGRHGCNEYRVNTDLKTPTESHPDRKSPRPRVQETLTDVSPEPSRTIKESSIPSMSPVDVLCEVIRRDTAQDFAEHRKALKKPLTIVAAHRLVSKVRNHPDPDAVFDESIANGWQGIFPDKVGQRHASNTRPDPTLNLIAHAARARST